MPLYAAAFFLPTSKSIPFLLEDVYVRGGYRTVATIDDRNAIPVAGRKKGMMVFVQEDNTIYWIPDATRGIAAWHKWDASAYVDFLTDDIISIEDTEDGRKLKVDPLRVLPVVTEDEASHVLINVEGTPTWMNKTFVPDASTGTAGQAIVMDSEGNAVWGKVDGLPDIGDAPQGSSLILDAESKPVWGKVQALPDTEDKTPGMTLALDENLKPIWSFNSGMPDVTGVEAGSMLVVEDGEAKWKHGGQTQPSRVVEDVDMMTIVVAGTADKTLQLTGSTVTLVQVALSGPDLLLEIHQTEDYSDTNPYRFRSSLAKLEDDGVTILEDSTQVASRRYAIFSALADRNMYIRVANEGEVSADVIVTLGYVPMEK